MTFFDTTDLNRKCTSCDTFETDEVKFQDISNKIYCPICYKIVEKKMKLKEKYKQLNFKNKFISIEDELREQMKNIGI